MLFKACNLILNFFSLYNSQKSLLKCTGSLLFLSVPQPTRIMDLCPMLTRACFMHLSNTLKEVQNMVEDRALQLILLTLTGNGLEKHCVSLLCGQRHNFTCLEYMAFMCISLNNCLKYSMATYINHV